MLINGIHIETGLAPYVVAEMSANHNKSITNVLKLLDMCAQAGASAFKLQTYTADSMTVDSDREDYLIKSGLWAGRKLYDLYSDGQTPKEWLPDIFSAARNLGITVFSTPFSPKDVQDLENLEVPAYKVASLEITYKQLLKEIAITKKPVILSTGLATVDEISSAIEVLNESNSGDIALLKCTTDYPADLRDLNLKTIPFLQQKFGLPVGFSDHTEGMNASVAAVAAGASIIEKHIKLDDDTTSVDASFSLNVSTLKQFVTNVNEAYMSMGSVQEGPTKNEELYLRYRRSLIAKKDIRPGEIFSEENIAVVRPNIGLSPKDLDLVLGKKANRNIDKGQGIKINFVS